MKTLGHVAHEEFSKKYATPKWINLSPVYQKYWDLIAKSIIDEHEKRKEQK